MDRQEAIRIIKNNWLEGRQMLSEALEVLIPELKESEDERMIKSFQRLIKAYYDVNFPTPEGFERKDMLAWLEKRGSQDNDEDVDILHRFSFYSYKDEPNVLYLAGLYVDNEYRNKGIGTKILKVANEVAANMKCNSIRLKTEKGSHAEKLYRENGYSPILEEDENQIWLEKQGEQKSTDKDDPKFKVEKDKWYVCTSQYCNCIEGRNYKASLDGRIIDDYGTEYDIHDDAYKWFRPWTIQDAKDGDVLATLDYILIFKKLLPKDGGVSYCHYDFGSSTPQFNFNKDDNWYFGKEAKVYPANKEQRDTLEKAMTYAGYTFDFEKKELKKIEQESTWNEKIKVLNELETYILSLVPDRPLDAIKVDAKNIRYIINKEQNPTWSEEDEQYVEDTLSLIGFGRSTHSIGQVQEWLKSLKDRVGCEADCTTTKEWSEEDEAKIVKLKSFIAQCNGFNKENRNKVFDLIDSIKFGHVWKPSDEQMKVLQWCMPLWVEPKSKAILESLINDLKKLKG